MPSPILALVAWSLVIWLWMYVTRLPAIAKAQIKLDPDAVRTHLQRNPELLLDE
ncbi:hypothetical protein [Microbulbifer rhizosphaerae]|uniref:Cation transporter-like permease n=1 Tax=Microbulbifer rhizosphaerae TaxID=1562603 RepID=A0A7W4W9U7_9GAMM|nr:hypothetical protein [Microbulbifer rhizosphaerae]MBB3060330.1 cation transporter-like permease [Microbulbifer rhizosphaerae]